MANQTTKVKIQNRSSLEINPATEETLQNISTIGLLPYAYDHIAVNKSGATTNIFTFKSGGSGGTTVATLTLTYTDSTKTTLSTIART